MDKQTEKNEEEFISPALKRIEEKARKAKERIDKGSEVNVTPYGSFDSQDRYTLHI